MTNELLLMALNVIKEYCIYRTDMGQDCDSCKLSDVCGEYFSTTPLNWEMELVEK